MESFEFHCTEKALSKYLTINAQANHKHKKLVSGLPCGDPLSPFLGEGLPCGDPPLGCTQNKSPGSLRSPSVFCFGRGERQNSGKSTWCRYLCPPALSEYMTDNLGTDKDSLISLSQNIIINLDELSTLQKADLEGLKSLFSLEIIKARRPYERITSRVPRTASFIGSAARPEFLTDEAGSVRWICIEIDTINWQYNTLPIDKVWAQAYACYRQGERGELTREDVEKNELINRRFQITSPEMELISKMFRPQDPATIGNPS